MTERIRWSWCVLGLAAGGCNISTTPPEEDFANTEADWAEQAPLDLREGRLAGQMGDVDGLEDGGLTLRGYGEQGGPAVIELHAATSDGAAMAMLSVYPSLDHPSLVPGAELHRNGAGDLYGGDLELDVLGCSGLSEGAWEFDEMADEVDVTVTDADGDDCMELTFTATFPGAMTFSEDVTTIGQRQTVVGSFEVGPLE